MHLLNPTFIAAFTMARHFNPNSNIFRTEQSHTVAPHRTNPNLLDIPDALTVGSVELSAVDSRDPPASTSLVLGLFTLQRLLSVPHGWAATEGAATLYISHFLEWAWNGKAHLGHGARENTQERTDS